jgi:hypothetical protein
VQGAGQLVERRLAVGDGGDQLRGDLGRVGGGQVVVVQAGRDGVGDLGQVGVLLPAPCAAAFSTLSASAPWNPADSTVYMPLASSSAEMPTCPAMSSMPWDDHGRFFWDSPAVVSSLVTSCW